MAEAHNRDEIEEKPVRKERSPGFKLAVAVFIGALLMVPLLLVYALVYDRQSQSETARNAIAEGWGDAQIVAAPVMVIPYETENIETYEQDGVKKSRTVRVSRTLYLSPQSNDIAVDVAEEVRQKSIYQSVVYEAGVKGQARFAIPEDLARYGVDPETLKLNQAEVRFAIADPRGLGSGNTLTVNGTAADLRPGKGLAVSNGAGFFAFHDWSEGEPLALDYSYGMRGNGRLTLVPRGGTSNFAVKSSWPHPNFGGDFLPEEREISDTGFTAKYSIDNLALGQSLVQLEDKAPERDYEYGMFGGRSSETLENSPLISLVEPVNIYSQVDRAVKYGFLFIGFTFLTFLLFDIIAGARVAAAEYLLTGFGLILFFVLLLAFAEVIGFAFAYFGASAAMIGLLSAYSAAVLGGAKRALFVGGILTGLYALLYVLLNMEAYALLVGSLLLFVALALVMYVTRNVDWSGLGHKTGTPPEQNEEAEATA
ncbi:MAG: cell envelope integrity protein CreD [Pseudomonadota bacterium]